MRVAWLSCLAARPPGSWRLARGAAACLAALLAAHPACGGSLTVSDAAGNQWRAISDPADDAQGYLLERRGADGRLDPRFGHDGRRPLAISATDDAPSALRVDERGRIWATGAGIAGGQPQVVVVRYLPDGSPDLTWGIQGRLQVIPAGLAIKPNDLLPLSDGSVLVAGVVANLEPTRAAVLHLRADGSLDPSFGSGGVWQRGGAADGATATSLAVADNGGVAVCVVARGDVPVVQAWSITAGAPQLLLQRTLDATSDGEDMRVWWVGSGWALGSGGAAAPAGQPASLDPSTGVPARLAAAASADPGQGGFSPFAAEHPAPVPTGNAGEDAGGLSGLAELALLAVIAAAAAVAVRVLRRRAG